MSKGLQFFHPDDRDRIRQVVANALENGESYDEKARLITARGNERWIRTRGKSVDEADQQTVRGYIQDITELAESAEK